MIGQTQNFSARIAVKGFLCATVLALVLIETLMLASSAHATVVTDQPEGGVSTQEVGAPGEGAAGAEAGTPTEATTPSTESTSTGEQTSANAETVTPAETTTPAETATPAETTTPTESNTAQQTPTETTPPEDTQQPSGEGAGLEEVIQTTKETVSQVGEALSPGPILKEVVVPTSEIVVPVTPIEERARSAESAREGIQQEALAVPTTAGAPPAPPSAPPPAIPPRAAILTTFPALAVSETQEGAAHSGAAAARSLTAAQRAGEISCELSGLTERMSEDCSAGVLYGSSSIAVDPVGAPIETSPARRVAYAGGGYSEPAGGGRSGGAPPGPPPGGAFGGSAAAGSGIALSGFFTLAGLLLFAAPCAMRRLRLSCRPWRTAFFVLIPERPG